MYASVTSFALGDNPVMDITEIKRHIADLLPSRAGEHVSDIEYLQGGYSNRNFAFTLGDDRLVIRIPLRTQPFVDRYHEAGYLQQLPDKLGAECLALDAGSGRMITRWVEGHLLIEKADSLTMGEMLDYLQWLHRSLPDPDRTYSVDHLVQLYAGRPPAAWPASQVVLTPCHNDLNPWNIIITPTGWITLDWEFVGHNDPLFDLVALQQGLCRSLEELPELAKILTPDQPALTQRLNTACLQFWRREAAWAAYQLKQGNVRPEIEQQVTDAQANLDNFVPF